MKLSIFILAFLGLLEHDYHVGLYDIEIKSGKFQISQKLFTDDFEKALKLSNANFVFDEEEEDEEFRVSVEKYIRQHFSISVNNQEIPLSFVGMEWEDHHVVYLYWESEKEFNNLSSFQIRNTVFLEVSPQQKNMHHIKMDDKKIDLLLEKGRSEGTVKLVSN